MRHALPGCGSMPDPYNRLTRGIDRLLSEFGKDCELVRLTPGGYDPETGTVSAPGEAVFAGRCVETGYELEHIPDTLIEAGDRVGIVKPGPGFVGPVTLHMKIRIDGELRSMREVQPVAPGPRCLYWRFVAY